MADLFAAAANERALRRAPLAERLRPTELDDVVGQRHLLGPDGALRRAIEGDRLPSAIFHGPPGTGKTTVARIVARMTGAAFEELSAVQVGKADVQAVIGRARDRLGQHERPTILFLDEIHRFNRAQQDALLPAVESGLVTLIGATTENPYAELNRALLSRCALFPFESLSAEDIATLERRAAAAAGLPFDEPGLAAAVRASGGDARTALAVTELAAETAAARGRSAIGEEDVADAAAKRPLAYDLRGDDHYDVISALIKSMRGSDADAAIYWLAVMIAGGEDPRFIARRLLVFASEDVGNADPRALAVAADVARAVEFVGLPEARINLAQGVTYLALAPKSNAAYRAIDAALAEVEAHGAAPPPAHLADRSWASQQVGKGQGYAYPHSRGGFVADQEHLPDRLRGRRFYEPTTFGFEARLRAVLDELDAARAAAAGQQDAPDA